MKLEKIPINQVEEVDLDEMAMCRLLGGADCCQCGCNYEGSGGSSTGTNSSTNDAKGGYTSDPGPQTKNCCSCTTTPAPPPDPPQYSGCSCPTVTDCFCIPMDNTRIVACTGIC